MLTPEERLKNKKASAKKWRAKNKKHLRNKMKKYRAKLKLIEARKLLDEAVWDYHIDLRKVEIDNFHIQQNNEMRKIS